METSNNLKGSKSNGGGGFSIGELFVGLAAMAVAYLVFLLVVYAIVFGLSAGAIYLGVMLGSNGQLGKKPRHQKVKNIEAEKQENLSELEGESNDLRELVVSSFENEKMDVYRPSEPEPIFSINADAVKTVVKKVAKKVAERTR